MNESASLALDSVPQSITESDEQWQGGDVYSTKGLFDGKGFVDPLLLGTNSFCGTDGDFEACTLGYLGGGNSGVAEACPGLWSNGRGAQTPGDASQPVVSTINPNGGLQHVRHQFDAVAAANDGRCWARSADLPVIADTSSVLTKISCDVSINQTGSQNVYIIQPQAPSEAVLTTVVIFNPDGSISVGDDATGPDDGFFTIAATEVNYNVGSYATVEIYVDNPNNRIVYFYDGLFVRSTGAGEGGDGGGVFAGTQAEQILLRLDQAFGADGPAFDDGMIVDLDNVCIEQIAGPVPGPNGACCREDPGMAGSVLCTVEDAASCAAIMDAVYAGDGFGCDTGCPDRIECLNGDGDCFTANATPGCDDQACCDAVCFASPFCCDVEWDPDCVAAAMATCPPPTACPAKADATGATGTCQDFSEANASTSLVGALKVADDFVADADGSITQICFWGAYLPAESTDDFTVTYYDCVDGVPNEVIATIPTGGLGGLSLVSRQDTGFQVAATAPIFEYVYNHIGVPVVAGEKYFVRVQNNTPDADMDGVGDTTWFWEWADAGTSPNANGIAFQNADDGVAPVVGDLGDWARFDNSGNDVAFCLNIVTRDQAGVCDLPAPTPCTLDTSGNTDTEGGDANPGAPEPCGVDPDINLGCTATAAPFLFTDLTVSTDPANPTLVAAESFADMGTRDIDWYRATALASVDANADLEVTVCVAIASELPMAAVLVIDDLSDGECGTTVTAAADAVGFDCAASLAIGYALSIDDGLGAAQDTVFYVLARSADGAELFEGAPCGGDEITTLGNDYLLELAVVDVFDDCFPDPPACVTDIEAQPGMPVADGQTGTSDLVRLLSEWGCPTAMLPQCAQPEDILPSGFHFADFDEDGLVGQSDLVFLLSQWDRCPQPGACFLPDMSCIIAESPFDCYNPQGNAGVYQGPGTSCP